MANESGLRKMWDATQRRQQTLAAHPKLAGLEQEVARAVFGLAQGTHTPQAVEQAIQARHTYLAAHKLPMDYAEPQWDCKACQDEGFLEGKPCGCREQAQMASRVQSSGLPEKLRRQTFDKFDLKWYSNIRKTSGGVTERIHAKDALDRSKSFVASVLEGHPRKGLFISGDVGLGKTFLLSAICNSLLEAGIPTLYIVFSDLIADIKRSFDVSERSSSESQIMATAKNAQVLILDDLGAEQVTDFVANRLFDIVNFRANYEKPLVVSSNVSLPELGTIYGPRISSRLTEMCDSIKIYGHDIRIQKTRQS